MKAGAAATGTVRGKSGDACGFAVRARGTVRDSQAQSCGTAPGVDTCAAGDLCTGPRASLRGATTGCLYRCGRPEMALLYCVLMLRAVGLGGARRLRHGATIRRTGAAIRRLPAPIRTRRGAMVAELSPCQIGLADRAGRARQPGSEGGRVAVAGASRAAWRSVLLPSVETVESRQYVRGGLTQVFRPMPAINRPCWRHARPTFSSRASTKLESTCSAASGMRSNRDSDVAGMERRGAMRS